MPPRKRFARAGPVPLTLTNALLLVLSFVGVLWLTTAHRRARRVVVLGQEEDLVGLPGAALQTGGSYLEEVGGTADDAILDEQLNEATQHEADDGLDGSAEDGLQAQAAREDDASATDQTGVDAAQRAAEASAANSAKARAANSAEASAANSAEASAANSAEASAANSAEASAANSAEASAANSAEASAANSAEASAGSGAGDHEQDAHHAEAPNQQAEGGVDGSLRCRSSAICEGAPVAGGCPAHQPTDYQLLGAPERDVVLACTTDPAKRAQHVAEAAAWSWKGYRECAWGWDELQPLSCRGSLPFNLSLTAVDSLDTLYLMGLEAEFEEAAEWVVNKLDVAVDMVVNLFETTIRVLGGLLSAHHLSRESHPELSRGLSAKAVELGERLMPALTASPSGIPYSDVNLRTGQATSPAWASVSSLSETSTLSLEFTTLARMTGRAEFEDVAMRVHEKLTNSVKQFDGLLPMFFNPETGEPVYGRDTVTLGSRTDSYYEYLLKQWILTGKQDAMLRQRYVHAMHSVRERLVRRTAPRAAGGLLYVGEQQGGSHSGKMDHLVCFLPGLLALGHYHGVDTSLAGKGSEDGGADSELSDLELAEELAASCYEMYRGTASGLAPEIAHFNPNADVEQLKQRQGDVGRGHFTIKPADAHSLLRPETVESLYVLWKVTGRPRYQEWGWAIFRAFQRWTRVDGVLQSEGAAGGRQPAKRGGGYTSLDSVLTVPPPRRDKMESFWVAETLKYLYLMFAEPPERCVDESCQRGAGAAGAARGKHGPSTAAARSVVSFQKLVFNTEAHPLPVVETRREIQ